MSIQRLPEKTVKLIGSAQVITSVSSVIKELMENSIDAGATTIEIRLENFGLEKIDVKDDGCGILQEDTEMMCQKSYTSKISDYSDLENNLNSYGFRGEALNAICAVSQVSITTITVQDKLAKCYKFNKNGCIIDAVTSHMAKGTTVSVEGLFKNLPVRRQFITTNRRKSDELQKTENIVKTLSVIHPNLKVTLIHNKCIIWQKSKVNNLKDSLVQILQPVVIKQLDIINYQDNEVKLEMLLPKKDCHVNNVCLPHSNMNESAYIYINKRPVKYKQLIKIIYEELFKFYGFYVPPNKYPFCLISVNLNPSCIDVNLVPDKTKILIKDIDNLKIKLRECFISQYLGNFNDLEEKFKNESSAEKRKNSDEIFFTKKTKYDEDLIVKETVENFKTENNKVDSKNKNLFEEISEDVIDAMDEIQKNYLSQNGDYVKDYLEKFSPVEMSETINILTEKSSEYSDVCITTENAYNDEISEMEIFKEITNETLEDIAAISKPKCCGNIEKFPEFKVNMSSPLSSFHENSQDNLELSNMKFNQERNLIKTVKINYASCKSGLNDLSANLVSPNSTNTSPFDRSVTSQLGVQNMSGFSKFAKEMRSMIIKQEPGISFTKVAQQLTEKWKELQDDEKNEYKEKAKLEKQEKLIRRKSLEDNKQLRLFNIMPSCRQPRGGVECKIKTEKKNHGRSRAINLNISLNEIKEKFNQTNVNNDEIDADIIGNIRNDIFICKIEDEIYAFNQFNLKETILFYKNLSNMAVPLKLLKKPIEITMIDLGQKLWSILINMPTFEINKNTVVVANEILNKNGFRVRIIKENKESKRVEITHVGDTIPDCSLDDFKELLVKIVIKEKIGKINLIDCRPVKVFNHVKNETIEALKLNNIMEKYFDDDVEKYLHLWNKEMRKILPNCPHDKPVLNRLTLIL